MIGILIIAHDALPAALADAVTHVLGAKPPQFEAMPVLASDDPCDLVHAARERVARLDSGDGVLIVSDLCGASPCNLAAKLIDPPHVEVLTGVNLPMLLRSLTYRCADMSTLIRKALSGARDGALQLEADHAAT
jgi:PTS system ascorbate-specific IIA component